MNNQASMPNGSATGYKMGMAGRDANGASVPGEFITGAAARVGLVQPTHNAQVIQTMTPQLYSQQRQRQGPATTGPMHNTQAMAVNQHGPGASQGQPLDEQKQQLLSNTMNSQQSYQNNGQVFFKKRASSNTASQHQNVLASPNQVEVQQSQQQMAS